MEPYTFGLIFLPTFQEALIHLGAKFSPCMRQDPQVHSFILAAREREKHSACCVRNDRSGCVQTSKEECSSTLAVWVKWPVHPSAPDLAGNKRQFGSVCHQDPRVCDEPSSEDPHEWPEDITKWPVSWNLPNVESGRRAYPTVPGAAGFLCWSTCIFALS